MELGRGDPEVDDIPVEAGGRVAPAESTGRPRVLIGDSREFPDGVWWDPFLPAKALLNSHMVILGSAGSGKTQAITSLIYELRRQGVPALILDFKDDYVAPHVRTAIAATLYDAGDGLPVNPLALPVDTLTNHVSVITQVYTTCGIFKAVYNLGDIQEAHLREALFKTYERFGISRTTRQLAPGAALPQFEDLKISLDELEDINLINRLSPIFDLSLFRDGAISIDELLGSTAVLRLSQLPSEEVKKAAGGILLRAVYNALLKRGHSQGLKLVLVIDEAHRIANLEPVKLLVKEARAYGVGVVLSSQEARDFDDFVFSNATSLLALKLAETSDADRVAKLLGGTSDFRAISAELRGLDQFQGFFRNEQYRPFARVRVRPFFQRHVP